MFTKKRRGNFKVRDTAIKALDVLALSLTNHNHNWTNSERKLYEAAVKSLS